MYSSVMEPHPIRPRILAVVLAGLTSALFAVSGPAVADIVVPRTDPPSRLDQVRNLHRSMEAPVSRLGDQLAQLRASSTDLGGAPGDRSAILALARDAELVARSADVISRKADRVAELSEELSSTLPE